MIRGSAEAVRARRLRVPSGGEAPLVPGYRIRGPLGSGPHGRVFLADQRRPMRVVALKVFHPARSYSLFRERLELWAETVRGLEHPHLSVPAEFGFTGDLAWVSAACLDGPRFWDLFAGEAPGLVRGLEITLQALQALEHLHARGLWHGDLRPGNILMDAKGRIRLADPMLHDRMRGVEFEDLAPDPIQVLKEWSYHSPRRRVQASWVGKHGDLYSAGALLYHCVTGELPVLGEAVRSRPIRVDGRVHEILRRLLSFQAGDRYLSAREALDGVSGLYEEVRSEGAEEAARDQDAWEPGRLTRTPVALYRAPPPAEVPGHDGPPPRGWESVSWGASVRDVVRSTADRVRRGASSFIPAARASAQIGAGAPPPPPEPRLRLLGREVVSRPAGSGARPGSPAGSSPVPGRVSPPARPGALPPSPPSPPAPPAPPAPGAPHPTAPCAATPGSARDADRLRGQISFPAGRGIRGRVWLAVTVTATIVAVAVLGDPHRGAAALARLAGTSTAPVAEDGPWQYRVRTPLPAPRDGLVLDEGHVLAVSEPRSGKPALVEVFLDPHRHVVTTLPESPGAILPLERGRVLVTLPGRRVAMRIDLAAERAETTVKIPLAARSLARLGPVVLAAGQGRASLVMAPDLLAIRRLAFQADRVLARRDGDHAIFLGPGRLYRVSRDRLDPTGTRPIRPDRVLGVPGYQGAALSETSDLLVLTDPDSRTLWTLDAGRLAIVGRVRVDDLTAGDPAFDGFDDTVWVPVDGGIRAIEPVTGRVRAEFPLPAGGKSLARAGRWLVASLPDAGELVVLERTDADPGS